MSLLPCPCCKAQLGATEITYQLHDILHKWESNGIAFSQDTWADYPDNIELQLFQCKKCGYGIFSPMTIGSEAFYTDITRNEYYLPDRWDFHVAIKALRSANAHSVLDVGCGRGAFLDMVLKQLPGATCYGNDANPAIRDVLPQGVTLHVNLKDAPDDLDAVTLFQVIEHVADPVGLLRESIAKVRPGGLVIVSVPDHSGPIRYFSDSHTAIPPHHVSIWMPASLNSLLTQLGLNVRAQEWEPLADYLMPFYLPKILSHKLGCLDNPLFESLVKRFLADPVTAICRIFKIKYLPLRGHTYLVVAQKGGTP